MELFVPVYRRFIDDRQLKPVIENYFKEYLGQFPAQVFDKINENFVRCSCYEVMFMLTSFKRMNIRYGRVDRAKILIITEGI